jgi:hypothetical protein
MKKKILPILVLGLITVMGCNQITLLPEDFDKVGPSQGIETVSQGSNPLTTQAGNSWFFNTPRRGECTGTTVASLLCYFPAAQNTSAVIVGSDGGLWYSVQGRNELGGFYVAPLAGRAAYVQYRLMTVNGTIEKDARYATVTTNNNWIDVPSGYKAFRFRINQSYIQTTGGNCCLNSDIAFEMNFLNDLY